ncbi:RPA-related protein RADX [Pholidichthys leucotaenia]
MAAAGCVLRRAVNGSRRSGTGPNQGWSPVVCRELLYVVELRRYSRDQSFIVCFNQNLHKGEDLYDVTLTDGDCRIQVTLDPSLNHMVERGVLRPGRAICKASFVPAVTAQLPECLGASDSYRLVNLEVRDDEVSRSEVDWASLGWFGSSEPAGPLVPLRANRSVFLPLWNNVDYSGEAWTEAPPTEDEDEEEEEEDGGRRPGVTVEALRMSFHSSRRGNLKGGVSQNLIVRILNKSHLMYYGKTDRNCECPYKAVLEVADQSGSVSVVLWNSMCVRWYRRLKPGDIISLRQFRVKKHYQAELNDIEISVNSRNPAAQIIVLLESSVSAEFRPPPTSYNFCSSKELLDRPPGSICDIIGLVTFSGRSERIRSKDGKGAELLVYRWLRLQDGASDGPVMVKLFATSQPETHLRLYPLSAVVCTRMKLIRDQSRSCCYLTNTTNTQVYCTGLGQHSEMSYRKLRPVKQFVQWLRHQEDEEVLSRALIGGFFLYPPPPVTLETYMKDRRGELGFLGGAELQREAGQLCLRERATFCIQATVTMVTYSLKGEEDRCLFWTDPSPSPSSSILPPPSTPPPFRSPLSSSSSSSFSPASQSSPFSHSTPRHSDHSSGKLKRKQLLQTDIPTKRCPFVALQPERDNRTEILFETSMEFLGNEDEDEEDGDDASFVTAPLLPTFPAVAMETLSMRYDYDGREEQAAAMATGGTVMAGKFQFAFEDYYSLRLKALSDGIPVDAIFLPHASSPLLSHTNTWTSILSHGAFSSHAPPPSPADLIAMAAQLANQRLACVLEACHLGGATTELVLSRAFPLIA